MRREDHRRLSSVGKYPLSSSLHDGIFDHDYNDHDDNVDNNGEYQTIPTTIIIAWRYQLWILVTMIMMMIVNIITIVRCMRWRSAGNLLHLHGPADMREGLQVRGKTNIVIMLWKQCLYTIVQAWVKLKFKSFQCCLMLLENQPQLNQHSRETQKQCSECGDMITGTYYTLDNDKVVFWR